MATYLNTKGILDSIQTRIADKSTTTRANLLAWLNDVMRTVINEPREWEFLKKSAILTITANKITLPTDFGRVVYIQAGNYFFTPQHELTEQQAYYASLNSPSLPVGFVCDLTNITFYGSIAGVTSATLGYVSQMNTDYTDSTADTIFPIEFSQLLIRSVLTCYKETHEEVSTTLSVQLDVLELKKMKVLDNRRKAV